jgi:hypothetical protein
MRSEGEGGVSVARPMDAHFITHVWGDEYVSTFAASVLASLLAPGNLPGIRSLGRSRYRIRTTPGGAELLRASKTFARLSKLMPVDILPIDPELVKRNRWHVLLECDRRAIEDAEKDGCAQVFILPDHFYSDGSFSRLEKLAEDHRLIAVPLPRVEMVPFLEAVRKVSPQSPGGAISVPPRELARLALANRHSLTRAMAWGAPDFHSWPSMLYWEVPGEGWLLRCFHLHPLFVRSRRLSALPSVGIDFDYVQLAGLEPGDFRVVEDSDEVSLVDLTRGTYEGAQPAALGASALGVASWAKFNANPVHRRFVRSRIRFHNAEPSGRWSELERESDRVVDSIESWLRLPSPVFRGVNFVERACRSVRRRL